MKATRAKWMYGIFAALLCSLPQAGLRAQNAAQKPDNVAADTSSPAAVAGAAEGTDAGMPQVRIGGGDLLEISVFDVSEMAQLVRVSDLGIATFNLIGQVRVAGMTTDEARDTIAAKLRDGNFILNPQVSVLIRQYGTQGVSILGEVARPGVYQVLGNRTLLDLLSEAGGTTPAAGPFATVKRQADGTELTIPISRNAKVSLASDVRLEPGDKVMIPRANLVYVIGDVSRPGAFLMLNDGRMSALQALALAGGNQRTAALNRVILVRKNGATFTRREVSIKNMMHARESDLELQADDILYVPNSIVKSVIIRGVPDIVQAATNAAVYANMP